MAGTATTNQLHIMYEAHFETRVQKQLYKTPVLYELCDKHPLPGGKGTTIYIPRQITPETGGTLTENTAITPCATSGGYYSATVAGWGQAIQYSDFLILVKQIPSLISDDLTAMGKYAGYWVDSEIVDQISGRSDVSNWLSPDGSVGQGSVVATTPLKQNFLFRASTTLASNNAPTYGDGNYAGVFHPKAVYDLFISTSAGSQLGTYNTGASSFLEGTESGFKKLESMTIGVLGKVRVLESTQSCKAVYGSSVVGSSSNASAHPGYVMGPGACAAVDLTTAKLKTYLKPPGSGGTSDPIDQITTAGVKLYFAAVGMDLTNRLVRTGSGTTL